MQASATSPKTAPTPRDAREIRAAPSAKRFAVLAAELGLLQLVFATFHTLDQPVVLRLTGIVFCAFLVHYWLPFRWKEPFWIAVSIAGSFFIVEPRVAEFVIAALVLFFAAVRAPVPFRWRIAIVALTFVVLMYCCTAKAPHIPAKFYPVFGAIFMFRMIVYLYDRAHSRETARLMPFLSYFCMLPNYFFVLFPVIDFQTMRRTYYRRDINDIAQQGVHWMTRGAIHLMLYRLVVYFNDSYLPDRVTSPGALAATMTLTFLLYLNVSGQFHIAVGMLHLFGYDLPETHRRYLLSSSIMDFWTRINIYWKDFMVKLFYFPTYFKLRKKGDLRAQIIGTIVVFIATWALHSYQFFWIRGRFEFTWTDTIFWTALGLLVIGNVLYDNRRAKQKPSPVRQGWAIHSLHVAVTFVTIITLWSFWNCPTIGSWIYLMTHWMRVGQ